MTEKDRRQNPDRRQRAPDRRTADRRRARGDDDPIPRVPTTQAALRRWVRQELRLSAEHERVLLAGIDALVARQEELWERSKADAINALTAGFRNRIDRLQQELAAREATVNNITQYFEQLISDLSIRATHDPKTHLMNFARFQERLETYLTCEQRGKWCAVGLVDITSFKWYNDTLGHAVGDRIIETVARLLRDQVRSRDLLAHDPESPPQVHARFGGDEFCFLVQDLDDCGMATAIADRFGEAVRQHDWSTVDERLATRPVHVDIGVACLLLGSLAARRGAGNQLARDLLVHADRMMYRAKRDAAPHAYAVALRVEKGDGVAVVSDSES